jgi:hypothetical protein
VQTLKDFPVGRGIVNLLKEHVGGLDIVLAYLKSISKAVDGLERWPDDCKEWPSERKSSTPLVALCTSDDLLRAPPVAFGGKKEHRAARKSYFDRSLEHVRSGVERLLQAWVAEAEKITNDTANKTARTVGDRAETNKLAEYIDGFSNLALMKGVAQEQGSR